MENQKNASEDLDDAEDLKAYSEAMKQYEKNPVTYTLDEVESEVESDLQDLVALFRIKIKLVQLEAAKGKRRKQILEELKEIVGPGEQEPHNINFATIGDLKEWIYGKLIRGDSYEAVCEWFAEIYATGGKISVRGKDFSYRQIQKMI